MFDDIISQYKKTVAVISALTGLALFHVSCTYTRAEDAQPLYQSSGQPTADSPLEDIVSMDITFYEGDSEGQTYRTPMTLYYNTDGQIKSGVIDKSEVNRSMSAIYKVLINLQEGEFYSNAQDAYGITSASKAAEIFDLLPDPLKKELIDDMGSYELISVGIIVER